jgi:cell wall-associated NlpC family hydrolase
LGFTNGLRVISLACLVTLAGLSIQPASAQAADPAPSPAPTAAPAAAPSTAPTAAPTVDPSSTPTSTTTPTPAPTVDPALATTPAVDPAVAVPALASLTTPTTPTAATTASVTKPSVGARIARIALAQRGKRYVRGTMGPRTFDCSGLVRYAYTRAGVSRRLGGGHSARGMLFWARTHHLASRSNPRVGDVVIYGGGSHAGIYIGNGLVISALNPRQGIRVTRLHGLGQRFTAFIHTHL